MSKVGPNGNSIPLTLLIMPKPRNKEALDIIEKCRSLDFVISELSGGVLVYVPLWDEFKKKLSPTSDESVRVREFRDVCKFFERISNKKAPAGHGRWHLWETGSFRFHGKFIYDEKLKKEVHLRRKDGRPVGEKW
jgi:hypothetical protein